MIDGSVASNIEDDLIILGYYYQDDYYLLRSHALPGKIMIIPTPKLQILPLMYNNTTWKHGNSYKALSDNKSYV